jgi:hypothetical protein
MIEFRNSTFARGNQIKDCLSSIIINKNSEFYIVYFGNSVNDKNDIFIRFYVFDG